MNEFDWGSKDEESPEQIANALQRVTSESHKRRIRQQAIFGGTAAILLVAAFIGGSQLDFGGDKKGDVTLVNQSEAPAPQDTVTTAPSASSTTTIKDPAASRPKTLYVAKNSNDGKGRIVAVDGQSGKEIQTLVSGSTMNELSLSPDGKTLFFTEMDESKVPADLAVLDHVASLKSVPVTGGTSTFYAYNAHTPKVSPDGSKVAYAELGISGVAGQVVVYDLNTHKSKVLDQYFPSSPVVRGSGGWVTSVAGWTDKTHVGAIVNTFGLAADDKGPEITPKRYFHIFDTEKVVDDEVLFTASDKNHVFAFPKGGDEVMYWGVLLSKGQLFVVEDNGNGVAARMLLIDASSGKVLQSVATGYVGRSYGNPSADASGEHLIYMSGNDVRVSDFGSEPKVLLNGVTSATW